MGQFLAVLREFGFPTFFCLWLMWRVERDLRDLHAVLHKQVILNAVIAKTLDVAESNSLPPRR